MHPACGAQDPRWSSGWGSDAGAPREGLGGRDPIRGLREVEGEARSSEPGATRRGYRTQSGGSALCSPELGGSGQGAGRSRPQASGRRASPTKVSRGPRGLGGCLRGRGGCSVRGLYRMDLRDQQEDRLEAGHGDPSMRLEPGSLCGVWGRCSCCSLDLSIPAPRGRAAGGLPRMPCSQLQAGPSQRERRCDWELEHLGFKAGGGGEEEVGGRVRAGVSIQRTARAGKGIAGWYSGRSVGKLGLDG